MIRYFQAALLCGSIAVMSGCAEAPDTDDTPLPPRDNTETYDAPTTDPAATDRTRTNYPPSDTGTAPGADTTDPTRSPQIDHGFESPTPDGDANQQDPAASDPAAIDPTLPPADDSPLGEPGQQQGDDAPPVVEEEPAVDPPAQLDESGNPSGGNP